MFELVRQVRQAYKCLRVVPVDFSETGREIEFCQPPYIPLQIASECVERALGVLRRRRGMFTLEDREDLLETKQWLLRCKGACILAEARIKVWIERGVL